MERLKPTEKHESMRGYFAYSLYNEMVKNKDIWFVTADLGFGMADKIMEDFPDRAINVGAAEQSALGIAVGLALERKKPVVYTISSFYMRAAETIALYMAEEKIPVIMVGGGRDDDYKHDGVSHFAYTTQKYMDMLGIKSYYPETKEESEEITQKAIHLNEPAFISLRR
jgi:transketolase